MPHENNVDVLVRRGLIPVLLTSRLSIRRGSSLDNGSGEESHADDDGDGNESEYGCGRVALKLPFSECKRA